MLLVSDVLEDVRRVLGGCDDATVYSRINDAVEILSTESLWDPLRGYVDICVGCNGCVTLPRQVGTPLAVNVCGQPTQGHDWLFSWHLNGPGNLDRSVSWHWYDELPVPTFRNLHEGGSRLKIQLGSAADSGKAFRVYGYGVSGDWVRTLEGGEWVDGFLVPMNFGTSTTNPNAPLLRRISRIEKPVTIGMVRLYAVSADGTDTYRIGNYYPEEANPEYRRIQVTPGCSSVRVAFRKAVLEVSSGSDLIPLHSKYAIVLMVKSLRKMDEDRIEEAEAYQKKAVQLLIKKQESVEIPSGPSLQISDRNLIADKADRLE